jgi:dihydrodipicolinate synthase/N-acetylneuraminate lyase
MTITGTGVPLVTPFDETGDVQPDALRELVGDLERDGVDFLVPCGSNGEAAHLDVDERTRVIECVADAATTPVVAGTGHPSERHTKRQTAAAADAGADAALVVTPYYYQHDQATIATHYRRVADDSPIPIYLYSVPTYTHTTIDPATVESLATHPNIAGLKDSSGDRDLLEPYVDRTRDASFDVLVGSTSVYAAGLELGAVGCVLAVANVAPDLASDVHAHHEADRLADARSLNRHLADLNDAVRDPHGIPGLKAAMDARDYPAGRPRRPFQPVDDDVRDDLHDAVTRTLDAHDR